ncbi:hypothetical protein CSC02_0509 [Enterobacter hormaechei subsp. hoffmannii]|nr:hypothetical protein CSC02_0509 [Enterobacter hormaechei subsp. hoffmannii]
MIGNNLTPFGAFFQGLNIDLNQKQPVLLMMFLCDMDSKNLVNNMYI